MRACFFVAAWLLFQSGVFAQQSKVSVAEVVDPVSIRLATPDKNNEIFRTIQITEGSRQFRFTPRNPVSCIPTNKDEQTQRGLFSTLVLGLQLDHSHCFFQGKYGSLSKHTLLAFVGEPGSGASSLYVLGFQPDGTPFKVLQCDKLDLIALRSIDSDSASIIGQPTLSQVMSGDGGAGSRSTYATTYDPASVYLIHAGSKATYSLDASREYNQRHYVWAGPLVREDYAVVYNLPGHTKPIGIPAKQLNAIMAKASPAHKQ